MQLRIPPRYMWLVFYLLLNIGYSVAIVATGHLFGESSNVALSPNTPIALIAFLVCVSYVLVLVMGFALFDRIAPRLAETGPIETWTKPLGPLLLILQLAFIAFFVATGTYVAGSATRDQSVLSALWVLVPVDMIFFIYYGIHPTGVWSRTNLAVWLVSGLLRGWTGGILTVLFLESCRALRSGKLRARTIVLAVLALVALYPPLYYAKLFYRFAGAEGFSKFIANVSMDRVWEVFGDVGVMDALTHSLQQIFDRLQVVSSAILVNQAAPELGAAIANGRVFPAWLEGIHGTGLYRALGSTSPNDLGQALAQYINPFALDTSWNSNPTLIGYLFATPLPGAIGVIVYVVALCGLSFFLMRQLAWTEATKDVLWYAWLVYLMAGWLGAFLLFNYSLLLLILAKTFLQMLARLQRDPVKC